MSRKIIELLALTFLTFLLCVLSPAQAAPEKVPYPAMAPLDRYLIPDVRSEIAFARSGAPASISDGAEVMVLRKEGYTPAVKGANGFVCVIERS